ncbi:MAG: hypothetical protein K2P79_04750, partial [Sphingomonas sp.]|nr:hypothetical protein [Sphingomonas sp.]
TRIATSPGWEGIGSANTSGPAAIVAIEIARAGTYSVALGDAAWVDIVQDGKPITSTGHEHGPPCSGIRKIVRFTLAPGRYALHLSGMKAATIDVLISRS